MLTVLDRPASHNVPGTLYLIRVLGGPVSEGEAREVLAGCGDLEKIWHCSPTEKECYRLPEGIWVTFAFFQDARDAQAVSRTDSRFRTTL